MAAEVIAKGGGEGKGAKEWRPTEMLCKEAADLLLSRALGRGSGDNITVIVVAFVWS
jgi:serine/threonine protein phosphatase PrpC